MARGTATTTTTTPGRKPTKVTVTRPRPIPREVKAIAAALAALGDPHRLAILGALAEGEILYATDEIAKRFGLHPDVASAALNVLRKRGLVLAIREAGKGGWRHRREAEAQSQTGGLIA
jgi:DNA-binding transcriptional ArsR family regulator